MEIQIIIVSLCIIILIIVIAFFRSRTTQEELSNKNLELKNINEKFNCFLEQSGEAFRIIDSDGKIILWNRANELLTGIKKSVALNQNFIDIAKILNSDFRQPTIDKISTLILKKTFQPFTVEKKIFTNSGEKKYVLESFFSIKTHDEILTGIISRDNTAKHQYEKELLAAKNKAEASEKIKTEFLAQMSHEIRTPINTILSYVALIEDELKNSENDLLIESFTSIHNSGDRIIRTVDLLLNMSEIQTGTYEPLIRKINLHKEIIRPLFLEYKMLAKSKGINLIQSIPSSELFVFADNYSISQILDNLISNAIKFTKKGTVEIFTGSDINVENEEYTYMGVRDTGIGMTKEFMEKMFSPFTQEEHGYTRSYEGNGLGLALVNQYCRINGIIIEVESKKNIGSCFTIKFINNTYLKNVNVDLCDEYENKYCVSN